MMDHSGMEEGRLGTTKMDDQADGTAEQYADDTTGAGKAQLLR